MHLCICNCSVCFSFLFHLFQICCTSLQTLVSHCTFSSQRLWRILLSSNTNDAANPRGSLVELITNSITLLVKGLSSNFILRRINHRHFLKQIPMASHLKVDLISLDPWHQFFSDSLGLIKVTPCCLKWTLKWNSHVLHMLITSFNSSFADSTTCKDLKRSLSLVF